MSSFSNTQKLCGTCARWTGPRDPGRISPAMFVQVPENAKGKCMGGGFNQLQMLALQSCSQYLKWPVLR